MSSADAALDVLAKLLAPAIADEVIRRLRAGDREGLIPQEKSPIGRRKHINLARKLIAEGSADAMKSGRTYFVRAEAIERYGAAQSKPASPKNADADDAEARLRLRYGLREKGAA